MGIAFELMAAVGKYTKDGEEKTRWLKCGFVNERDGKLSVKIECMPVGGDFDGWLSCFEPKERESKKPAGDGYAKAKGRAPVSFDDMDSPPF